MKKRQTAYQSRNNQQTNNRIIDNLSNTGTSDIVTLTFNETVGQLNQHNNNIDTEGENDNISNPDTTVTVGIILAVVGTVAILGSVVLLVFNIISKKS